MKNILYTVDSLLLNKENIMCMEIFNVDSFYDILLKDVLKWVYTLNRQCFSFVDFIRWRSKKYYYDMKFN